MIVVADSSPLIVLVKLQRADLLASLFGTVLIPTQVASELSSPRRPSSVRTFVSPPPSWLEIRRPSAMLSLPHLDEGERAAISLAR